ncbi:MAG: hypothetical protein K1X95_05540 [Acidimicrobiia bacterium]|nr:hypothetical protein [Acidimicrobiia bacterium]
MIAAATALAPVAACAQDDGSAATTTAAADDPTAVPDAGTVAAAGGYTVVFTDPSLSRVPPALSAQAEKVQTATIISPESKPVAAFVLVTPKTGAVLTDAILAQVLAGQFGAPHPTTVAGKPALAATAPEGTAVIARVNEDGILAMFVGYPGVDETALLRAVEAVAAVPAPPP